MAWGKGFSKYMALVQVVTKLTFPNHYKIGKETLRWLWKAIVMINQIQE